MTDVSTILTEIEDFVASYEAQRAALVEKLRPQIQGIFAPFFVECPTGAVAFTAFTPYFNDGEECEFSVNEVVFHSDVGGQSEDTDDEDADDEDDFDGDFFYEGDIKTESYYRVSQSPEQNRIADIAQACKETFAQIPDDMIEGLFGDHVSVIIRPGSIVVEEFDHE